MHLPRTPDEITVEWLVWAMKRGSAHLNPDHDAIVGVQTKLLSRQGAYGQIARLQIERKSESSRGPRTLIAKLSSASEEMRYREATRAACEREVRFYSELAPTIEVPVPQCHFADIELATGWHIVLLEDLSPAQPAVGALTPAQAQEAVELIARLHVHWWRSRRLSQIKWIHMRPLPPDKQLEQGHRAYWSKFQDRIKDIDGTVREIGDQLGPQIGTLLRHLYRPETLTIIHGDLSIGNLLYRENGTPSLQIVDWQLIAKGPGVWDVAWLLSQHVEPRDRRAIEHQLLERYVEIVAASGIPDYSIDGAIRDYRVSILARFRTVITSIVALPFSAETKAGIVSKTFPRFCEALVDNDCLEQLHKMPR